MPDQRILLKIQAPSKTLFNDNDKEDGLPLGDGNPLQIFFSGVEGTWPDETVVLFLLEEVSCPSGDTAHGENTGVEIRLNADRVVNRS